MLRTKQAINFKPLTKLTQYFNVKAMHSFFSFFLHFTREMLLQVNISILDTQGLYYYLSAAVLIQQVDKPRQHKTSRWQSENSIHETPIHVT